MLEMMGAASEYLYHIPRSMLYLIFFKDIVAKDHVSKLQSRIIRYIIRYQGLESNIS